MVQKYNVAAAIECADCGAIVGMICMQGISAHSPQEAQDQVFSIKGKTHYCNDNTGRLFIKSCSVTLSCGERN